MAEQREPRFSTIPRHDHYFRESPDPPPHSHALPSVAAEIVGWEVFVLDGEFTPCYSPVVRVGDTTVQASNSIFCTSCERWIQYGQTIAHYKEHARAHQTRERSAVRLTDPNEINMAFLELLLRRGMPFAGVELLRRTAIGEHFP